MFEILKYQGAVQAVSFNLGINLVYCIFWLLSRMFCEISFLLLDMYLLFRLLSEVQLISVAINIFFVSLVCHQTLASWKVWRTLELVPPASAANSSGNITAGYHGGFSEQAAPLCLKTHSILF